MSFYTESGVNIDEGNRFVSLIKDMVASTCSPNVIGGLGGFAGLYDISQSTVKEPVLVSSTDGVGTKLKVAIAAERLDSVGIDLVAMSVNDILVTGARPLFFLDYISSSKLLPEVLSKVVAGIAAGCRIANVSLLGGETAEMPGMYAEGDFDLAGFVVGLADKKALTDRSNVIPGDIMIGIASSGFHSNGYSLLRKVFFKDNGFDISDNIENFGTVGDLLLTPTKIYSDLVGEVLKNSTVHSMAHITGGGFYDNIPRSIPEKCSAYIKRSSIKEPPPIKALRAVSDMPEKELYRVFNMGVGYIFIASPNAASEILNIAEKLGESAWIIGEIKQGSGEVFIEGVDF
ncbi:MAG: phosphoribosylformylglycinamidine cyclo-ligase [Deferribacteraceae bacterium]|jgi:phosphoribosylformylglycinamidine cyclo-ligase|nr:phosphoribosylformylglycinamidine cyclo-ligase [Deferribacteraceae bacterium]